MMTIAAPLLPIMFLILFGYALKRIRFVPETTWAGMEKLAYYFLFPALLVSNLARQELSEFPWLAMLAVVVGTSIAAAAALALWHTRRKSVSGDTFTSIFQGGVRFNSYIALAVSEAFFGGEGLAACAVASGLLIITVNLLSISAFAVWGSSCSNGPRAFLRDVAYNPLILACIVGGFLGASGIGLDGVAADVLGLVSRAALPVGLLAVGAALMPEAIRGHLKPVIVSSIVQFGLKPLVAATLISTTGLAGVAAGVLYIVFVTPVAPSSFVLSRQLGGDSAVMASIITLQTVFAFIALPAMAYWVLNIS